MSHGGLAAAVSSAASRAASRRSLASSSARRSSSAARASFASASRRRTESSREPRSSVASSFCSRFSTRASASASSRSRCCTWETRSESARLSDASSVAASTRCRRRASRSDSTSEGSSLRSRGPFRPISGPMVLQLRSALQALFLAGAAHDVVALAEANARALGAVLVPERQQLLVDVLDLVHESPAAGRTTVAATARHAPRSGARFPHESQESFSCSLKTMSRRGFSPVGAAPSTETQHWPFQS